MGQEALIRKLADYVLLNAYSVNSTGLYNGKAGLSLSHFGVTRNSSLVRFLNAVKDYYPGEEINHWINLFSTEASHLLDEKFDKAETITNQGSKIGTLRLFETYVKLADCYDPFISTWSLLEKHDRMYQANKFMSTNNILTLTSGNKLTGTYTTTTGDSYNYTATSVRPNK